MCFVWISEQTAIISLYSINWLVFITETECVYCAVRTESSNRIQVTVFLFGEGPRSRRYGGTAALSLIVQPCDKDEEKYDQFFSSFQAMDHRWNEIDRGKPKYTEKKLCQCHFVHHKSHMD
jgi:hypothetical protein